MEGRDEINKKWEDKWITGKAPWHKINVNPFLTEFFYRFSDGDFTDKRVYVPLCGKALELKWLYDKGMCVVGVELSELAVKSFFEEHNLTYQVETCPLGPVYRHDNHLSIFLCDIFKVDTTVLGGAFDYLWDRGAFEAMVYKEQQKYCDMLDSVLSSKAQGLVECIEYERSMHPGPPYSIPKDEFLKLTDGKFDAEQLCARKNSDLPEWYRTNHPGLVDSVRTMYYIKRDTV